MQAVSVPMIRGVRWFAEGFALYRRNPLAVTFAVFSYWFLIALASWVPVLGAFLAPMLTPALSLGVMGACRAVDRKQAFLPQQMFEGFRGESVRVLFHLGGIYLLGTLLALALTTPVDGGMLFSLMMGGARPEDGFTQDDSFLLAVEVALLFLMPLFMAFWFSPMLAGWAGQSASKSMFFSFFACWRNWRPFLAYGATVVAVSVLLPGFVMAVAALVAPAIAKLLMSLMMIPFAFVLMPTFFASVYVSYRDVFQAESN